MELWGHLCLAEVIVDKVCMWQEGVEGGMRLDTLLD